MTFAMALSNRLTGWPMLRDNAPDMIRQSTSPRPDSARLTVPMVRTAGALMGAEQRSRM